MPSTSTMRLTNVTARAQRRLARLTLASLLLGAYACSASSAREDASHDSSAVDASRVTMHVSVAHADGTSVPWAWIEIDDAAGASQFAGNTPSGAFDVPLPRGAYSVRAWDGATLLGQTSVDLETDLSAVVGAAPSYSLLTEARHGDGSPIDWAWVELTDTQGKVAFQGNSPNGVNAMVLLAGSYHVRAFDGATLFEQTDVALTGNQSLVLVEAASPSAFVGAANGRLTLDGAPLPPLIGFNHGQPSSTWTGCPLGGPANTSTYDPSLEAITSNAGANVVRLWFLQSRGGPGNWDDFDLSLADAKARGLRVIVTLENEWGDCEPPFPDGTKALKRLAWYQGGYAQANDGYPLSYLEFASAVVARYAGNTEVLTWELVNEAQARNDGIPNVSWCDEPQAAAALQGFQAALLGAGGALRKLDPNHLMTVGVSGDDCGAQGGDFGTLYAGPSDLCDLHEYGDETDAVPAATASLLQTCTAIGKPVLVGENGMCRSVQADGTCAADESAATLGQRASFLQAKWQGAFAAGAAGYLVWTWAMDPSTANGSFDVGPGDPVVALMKAATP